MGRPGRSGAALRSLCYLAYVLALPVGLFGLFFTYGDQWLKLQTPLSDGTVVRIQATSWGGCSVRTRRKRKTVKHRVSPLRGHCQVSVQLSLNPQACHNLPRLLEALPNPVGFTRQQIVALKSENGKLSVSVRYLTCPYPDLKQVMQPLLWLYAGLRAQQG